MPGGTGTPATGAISKSDIMDDVLHRLNLVNVSINSIDVELGETLVDISGRESFLKREEEITLVAGTREYSLYADITEIHEVQIEGKNKVYPMTMEEYHIAIHVVDGVEVAAIGPPKRFAYIGGQIFFDPKPNGADTVNLWVSHSHPQDPDDIQFPVRFRYCIAMGVLSRLFSEQLRTEEGAGELFQVYQAKFEQALGNLTPEPSQPGVTIYRDM